MQFTAEKIPVDQCPSAVELKSLPKAIRRPGGRGDGFQRLQRIGNDAAANDNLTGCAHKISGWPQKGAKEFTRRVAGPARSESFPSRRPITLSRQPLEPSVRGSRSSVRRPRPPRQRLRRSRHRPNSSVRGPNPSVRSADPFVRGIRRSVRGKIPSVRRLGRPVRGPRCFRRAPTRPVNGARRHPDRAFWPVRSQNRPCGSPGAPWAAGSPISFSNAGPVGEATGSSVFSGSGTMLPQTTI